MGHSKNYPAETPGTLKASKKTIKHRMAGFPQKEVPLLVLAQSRWCSIDRPDEKPERLLASLADLSQADTLASLSSSNRFFNINLRFSVASLLEVRWATVNLFRTRIIREKCFIPRLMPSHGWRWSRILAPAGRLGFQDRLNQYIPQSKPKHPAYNHKNQPKTSLKKTLLRKSFENHQKASWVYQEPPAPVPRNHLSPGATSELLWCRIRASKGAAKSRRDRPRGSKPKVLDKKHGFSMVFLWFFEGFYCASRVSQVFYSCVF